MYSLPANTLINQPLFKKAVFEKFNLKTVERERFDADISKMALVARISPATVPALAEGQEIKGFYVLQVTLKHQDYDVKNILVLQNWLERIRKEVTNKVLSIKRISDFLIFPILAQPTLKKI